LPQTDHHKQPTSSSLRNELGHQRRPAYPEALVDSQDEQRLRKLIGNNHNAGRGQKRQNRFETGRKPATRLIALGVVSFSGPRSDFIVYSSAVVYLVDEAQ
jgi:chromosome condensin MukBEF MukE localization factor